MRGVLLLAALLLVPAAAAKTVAEVAWRDAPVERRFEGRLAEGGEQAFTVDFRRGNLTRVDAVLAWDDRDGHGLSRPDRLSLGLDGPRPYAAPPAEGDGGLLVATARVGGAPGAATLAEGADLAAWASEEGDGAWSATVRLTDAGDPEGAFVDPGESFVLTLTFHRYEAVVLRVVTLEGVADAAPDDGWKPFAGGAGAAAAALGLALWRRPSRRRHDEAGP